MTNLRSAEVDEGGADWLDSGDGAMQDPDSTCAGALQRPATAAGYRGRSPDA